MDRKTTIKILRMIIRDLKNENLFEDDDFVRRCTEDSQLVDVSRAENYIIKVLQLPFITNHCQIHNIL